MDTCRRTLFAVVAIVVFLFFAAPRSYSASDLPQTGPYSPTVLNKTTSDIPNLIRVPLVRQYTDFTCGAESLQSILGYYGQDYRGNKLAKALRTSPKDGTYNQDIVRVAVSNGYRAEKIEGMTFEQLKAFIDARTPVILAIQAWSTPPVDWARTWEDGHYVVAIGYDSANFYFMDPSTIGNYTYIPADELLARWHDKERKKKLVHLGIAIGGKAPAYDPKRILKMD